MAETTPNIAPQEHIPETITPPDTLDTLVQLSPGLGVEIERYKKSIVKLSPEQQESIINQWKDEISHGTATIGILDTLIKQSNQAGVSKIKEKATETEIKADEKVAKADEKVAKADEKDTEKINELNNVAAAAESAKQYTDKINTAFGGKFTNEIQRELQSDIEKPETLAFLATLGVDTKNPEALKDPQIQNILMARAGVQICIKHEKEISEKPELAEDMKNLKSLRFTLGLSDRTEAKNITNLLTDQPKSDREAITSTVSSLTKGAPDTMITRTGDRLTFQDPKNERYSYNIDMAKRPPQLSKSLGKLSISREIVSLSREDQEKSDKKTQAEKQLKSSQDTLSHSKNDFWQIRRDEYAKKGENKADGTEGVNLYSQYIGENRGDHARYETLEQAYAQGDIADKDKVSTLEQMRSLSEKMYMENISKGSKENLVSTNRTIITDMLGTRIEKLSILKRSEESLARVDKKALEYTSAGGGSEQWEKNASESLSFFSELGLNDLKQQGFEDVMEAYNEKKKDSSKHQIHLSENPKIDDIQRKEFREMIDKFTGGSNIRNKAFVDLLNNLTSDKFRENNWNTKEKRAEYLFGDKKPDLASNVDTGT